MQGLLAYDQVVQRWCVSSGVLNYIQVQVHPFTGRVLLKGELDVTHLFRFKGAIESTP